VNYVPVESDMSDLVEKVAWLKEHDDAARQVGNNGRELADSLEYTAELARTRSVIDAAARFFSGRPEAVWRVSSSQNAKKIPDGAPIGTEADGAVLEGLESRFQLPRPIACDDFVLTLEVSPPVSEGVTQRLNVVVNGELLQTATVASKRQINCRLPRQIVERSDKLNITILHPDAAPAASAARPLDTRMLSVLLHQLVLTPASLVGPTLPEGRDEQGGSVRATRQGAIMNALYGRDVWHGFIPSRPRAPEAQGWNGRHPVFARVLDEVRTKTVIDVAVWKGQSTIFVAELMRERHLDGCIVAVDTFLAEEHWPSDGKLFGRHPGGRPDVYETFLENVSYAGVADLVVPLSAPSAVAAKLLAQRGISAGLIHLDASREYGEVLKDANDYWQLLEPGGYLIGDDYDCSWPGVVQAAGEFAAQVGVELEVQSPKWLVRKPLSPAVN
jgi:hypothetical protein